MNGLTNNGERGVDGATRKGWGTLTRIAAALERRFKRECEAAEPVSTLVDHATVSLAVATAIFWALAILRLANEPDWRWENVSEASAPNSLIWIAFGAATALAAFLSLATRAVWTVALLCRKKGVQATLFFWAGIIAFGVALAEGAWLAADLLSK